MPHAATYWNVFNVEGESSIDAAIVTYASLSDRLHDQKRTGIFTPDGSVLFGTNIDGSGADILSPIPEPMTSSLAAAGLALIALRAGRRRGHCIVRAAP